LTQTFGIDLTSSVIRRNINVSPEKLDKGNFYGKTGVRAKGLSGTQFVTAKEYIIEYNNNTLIIPQETRITIGHVVDRNIKVPNGTVCNIESEFIHETFGTKIRPTDNCTLEVGTIISIDPHTKLSLSIPFFTGQLILQNFDLPYELICMTN